MTSLLAPYCNDLGHDAGEVGMHDSGVKGSGWPVCHEIDYGDSEFSCRFPRGRESHIKHLLTIIAHIQSLPSSSMTSYLSAKVLLPVNSSLGIFKVSMGDISSAVRIGLVPFWQYLEPERFSVSYLEHLIVTVFT